MTETPEILYKYYPAARLEYFDNELVRLTQPSALNDPFECLPSITDKDLEQLKKEERDRANRAQNLSPGEIVLAHLHRQNNPSLSADFLRDRLFEIQQEELDKYGIFSLSAVWENPLMWSHYASSHSGFCIGFDTRHESFKKIKNDLNIEAFSKVTYTNQRPQLSITPNKTETETREKNKMILCSKSEDWSYEHEYRLISNRHHAKILGEISLFEVSHSSIKEIIIGMCCNEELRNKIRLFCKSREIQCYESFRHEISYEVSRKKLELLR